MKQILIASLLTVVAAGALAKELEVRHAAEIEFETERGHYYQVQRSTNLLDWQNVEDRVYGHGRRERHLYSGQGGGIGNREFFRVVMTDAPTNGLAPWSVSGLTISFDDEPGGDLTQFLSETNGVDLGAEPDPFLYTLTPTGSNDLRLELNYSGAYYGVVGSNKIDRLMLTFTSVSAGTWSRDKFRNGVLKDHDTGLFRVGNGTPGNTNMPPGGTNVVVEPPAPPAPPVSLSNTVYYFQNSGTPDRYLFTNMTGGIEIQGIPDEGLPTNGFAYTYSVQGSNTAALHMNFGYYGAGGDRYDIDLTFTDGPSGHFVRREYRRGVLKDTDTGSFSPYLQPPTIPTGGTNQPTLNTNAPPASPQGFTYTMLSGAIPERLTFQSATAGLQLDDSAPTDFTYTYQSTGSNTFALVVQFKADKWDEYDLTFTDGGHGSFVRRQFDKNELKDTDAAQFTVGPTLN